MRACIDAQVSAAWLRFHCYNLHSVCRSYRTGEYPDIEAVTPKSILEPLTVLASQRAAVANPLLAAVLGSLVAAAGSSDDGAAAGGHRSSRGGRVDGRARTVLKVSHKGYVVSLQCTALEMICI